MAVMNDEVNKMKFVDNVNYKLVACKNCRTVNAMFVEDLRKRKTLDCRVCGKKLEYITLKGSSDDAGDTIFEGENIEKDVMSQFL